MSVKLIKEDEEVNFQDIRIVGDRLSEKAGQKWEQFVSGAKGFDEVTYKTGCLGFHTSDGVTYYLDINNGEIEASKGIKGITIFTDDILYNLQLIDNFRRQVKLTK